MTKRSLQRRKTSPDSLSASGKADGPSADAPVQMEHIIAQENAGWVREFLANARSLTGCCFCENDAFHVGRAAVERVALALDRQDDSLLPTAHECVDVLEWLTCIEPIDAARYCHGCSGKGGYAVVLDTVKNILAAALERQEETNDD